MAEALDRDMEPGAVPEGDDVVFDYGPEGKAVREDIERKRRFGPPVTNLYPDMGLMTFIGGARSRLQRLNRELMERRAGKTLATVLRRLREKCMAEGVSRPVCEDAARLARILCSMGPMYCSVRGHVIVDALIYLAAKVNGEVYDVGPGVRRAAFRLGWLLAKKGYRVTSAPVDVQARRYVSRITDDPTVQYLAMRLYPGVRERARGLSPKTLAALVVYVAGKALGRDKLTQERIAERLGITPASIRGALRRVKPTIRYVFLDGDRVVAEVETYPGPKKPLLGLREAAYQAGIVPSRVASFGVDGVTVVVAVEVFRGSRRSA